MQLHIQGSGHLFTPDPRVQEEVDHLKVQEEEEEEQGREQMTQLIHPAMHTQEEEQVSIAQEEESHQETGPLATMQEVAVDLQDHHHHHRGAGNPGSTPPTTPPTTPPSGRTIDPWASLDRSRKPLPKLSLPSNYKNCSILDMQQMLEVWYDKSTFTITTWRGDAQRYWLTQVLDLARARHDQWFQVLQLKEACLEPAYILGDRKHNPEATNAVESVLRTELLEVIPKPLAEACMRHGYCTAELIVWHIMKQLILPPDVNEVTMQKEILTPPEVPPATLDQASVWLEEMQHRLSLCIKTKQNVHPRTIVAFVNDTLSGVTQYYRTVGIAWDSLYAKHQLHEYSITLDRVYTMLAEFFIELKLHEEQDKIAQIVTGSSGTAEHFMSDEYTNASKGTVPSKGKRQTRRW